MNSQFEYKKIEKKWQEHWEKSETVKCDLKSDKPKFYNLCMYPYPLEICIWDILGIIRSEMLLLDINK